jgi:hypothetical protein
MRNCCPPTKHKCHFMRKDFAKAKKDAIDEGECGIDEERAEKT